MPTFSAAPRPPGGPWVMRQAWHDLLFAHWKVPVDALRSLIPHRLTLDLFEGEAWLGVVPFRMTDVAPRFVPALPGFSAFLELNVRTYVTDGHKPGVWFFSLDAANRLAVAGARALFGLPYFNAEIALEHVGEGLHYRSRRHDPRGGVAALEVTYSPTGPTDTRSGSLARWLTERYCLYAARGGRIFRTDIHHCPWPLENARATWGVNTMAAALGIALEGDPLCHFSRSLAVRVWGPREVAATRRE